MIQLPTRSEILTLGTTQQPHGLSIYSGYLPPSSPNNPNRIQFKNLLKEARRLLADKKYSERDIAAFLEPADKLLSGEEFRVGHDHSLGVFIGQDFFRYYRLPSTSIESSIQLGRHFNVQPILDLIDTNLSYFLLCLSHNNIQLLRGDRYSIKPLELDRMPTNMEQSLRIDEYPKEIQTHSVAPTVIGKGSEQFHGQYNARQVDKDMLVRFFRKINTRLARELKGQNIPLILAGVEYLLPLYRQVNTYAHLVDRDIIGNVELAPLLQLQQQAATIVTSQQPA
jgi:hypothetical protein